MLEDDGRPNSELKIQDLVALEHCLNDDDIRCMSKIIIPDNTQDERYSSSPMTKNHDHSDMDEILDQHIANKTQFVGSEDFAKFSEMVVVAQIRSNLLNSDEFFRYILAIERAIRRAVRNMAIQRQSCENKQQFEEIKSTMLRTFYQDITIGFITSTGQLKATTYFFLNTSMVDSLHQKQIHLQFKKQMLKITTYFSNLDATDITPKISSTGAISFNSFANILQEERKQEERKNNTNTLPTQCSNNLSNLSGISSRKSENDFCGSQLIIQQSSSKKQYPCHNIWIKMAFIRTDKFRNEFIQIQKPKDEELKSGISIHFVYRPMDDQIYAIKKSQLQSSRLSFYDVFSTMQLQDMNSDHRKIREAKILSKLNHPNVLRLYDWWVEEEIGGGYALYMQLEYCSFPGFQHQTNDLLDYSYYYLNPMGNEEKVLNIKKIMLQIVDGLEYIHNRGIVHRDLKPENIFVSITTHGELQVMLADFDQGKDVRELKLSNFTDMRISDEELNSIKSRNTIQSGTSGYQTPNSNKDRPYDQCDEFYALGVTLLHLIMTFPGEPKNRNHYTTTFVMSDVEDVLSLFDVWSNKFVKNKPKTFTFEFFTPQLQLAKDLIDQKLQTHDLIRDMIKLW